MLFLYGMMIGAGLVFLICDQKIRALRRQRDAARLYSLGIKAEILKPHSGLRDLMRTADVGLIVVNELSTAFYEALACNVPTLAVVDPNFNKWKDDLSYLHDAGVLHYDNDSAMKFIAGARLEDLRNLKTWWIYANEARIRFCRAYCRPSRDWRRIWLKKLLEAVIE